MSGNIGKISKLQKIPPTYVSTLPTPPLTDVEIGSVYVVTNDGTEDGTLVASYIWNGQGFSEISDEGVIGVMPSIKLNNTSLTVYGSKDNPITDPTLTIDDSDLKIGAVTLINHVNSIEPTIATSLNIVKYGSYNTNSAFINQIWLAYTNNEVIVNITSYLGVTNALDTPTDFTYTQNNSNIILSWSSVIDAENYVIESDTDISFNNPTEIYNGALLSFSTSIPSQDTYYRVKATATGFSDSGFDLLKYIVNTNSISADITNKWVRYQNIPLSTPTSDLPFSIFARVLKQNNTESTRIFSIGSSKQSLLFFVRSNGKVGLYLYETSDQTNRIAKDTNNSIAINNYFNVGCSYDGSSSSNGIKLYIEGVNTPSTSNNAGTYNTFSNNEDSFIGRWANVTSPTGEGLLAEIAIFNRVLSDAEFATLHNGGVNYDLRETNINDMIAYFTFEDSTANDCLGNISVVNSGITYVNT